MNKKDDLDSNYIDVITSAISVASGYVPIVGGVLSEVIQNVIPNQREDRIVKFIRELSLRLEELEFSVEKLKKIYSTYEYGAFTYRCLSYVANEVYEEKLILYKNLCINGLTSEKEELFKTERILKIISDMDYYEIMYLKFYYYKKWGNQNELSDVLDKLKLISTTPIYTFSMSDEEMNKETYKEITLMNLTSKGLIEPKIKIVGKNTNKSYGITTLGEMIIKKIGVINNE